MKMTLNEEIELLRNGKWFDKIGGTLPNDEYLNLGWAIGDVLDTLESLRMLQPKVETNADRIRVMSDHDLAVFLEHAMYDSSEPDWMTVLSWLQQPAEEETENG